MPHPKAPHACPCNLTPMPLLEVYNRMRDNVARFHDALHHANHSRDINPILTAIYEYPLDYRVSDDIRNLVKFIQGMVPSMHTHDFTREEMCNLLKTLHEHLGIAISQEEEKAHRIKEAKDFFLFLANNAEDFLQWMDEMKNKI